MIARDLMTTMGYPIFFFVFDLQAIYRFIACI